MPIQIGNPITICQLVWWWLLKPVERWRWRERATKLFVYFYTVSWTLLKVKKKKMRASYLVLFPSIFQWVLEVVSMGLEDKLANCDGIEIFKVPENRQCLHIKTSNIELYDSTTGQIYLSCPHHSHQNSMMHDDIFYKKDRLPKEVKQHFNDGKRII